MSTCVAHKTRPEVRAKGSWTASPWQQFLRHLAEMVVAMEVGMLVLVPLTHALMARLGYPEPGRSIPLVAILVMTFDMSLPMVLWMALRRHGWARSLEMAAVMFVPAIALIVLSLAGVISGAHAHSTLHTLMWPSMLLLVLIRRRAYVGHCQGRVHILQQSVLVSAALYIVGLSAAAPQWLTVLVVSFPCAFALHGGLRQGALVLKRETAS
jgi:hypothetical protein